MLNNGYVFSIIEFLIVLVSKRKCNIHLIRKESYKHLFTFLGSHYLKNFASFVRHFVKIESKKKDALI